ncbi:hypothetical protein ABW16_01795 [Mycolicibacter heraklionensis]|uniref:PE domain-containing protein n=1 Tax=Mycolicibacter heraklionensis TaxID=512402 RepID=A0ABR5FKN0_9MYCO|nr:hypothetical protein [Mycolicibacter heraklionensis]KLO31590.1 hypothetical protein ABW16_01795 [Mycolicibacter heraklionensis]
MDDPMVSHNPEKTGLTVNVAPVLNVEELEAIAEQIEQRIGAAVAAGLQLGFATLFAALGVEPAALADNENGAG